ncbi:hypothetical protein ElyMa_006755400 [Elysia marginata]|uniref:Uncharacterized protein n=1 Tax=Elysia marginata TaxID=1093978 RepID=A0AAV4IW53_9GAST|nr:hypothetical protein ElyMa_006755400 [Elysia marginata]
MRTDGHFKDISLVNGSINALFEVGYPSENGAPNSETKKKETETENTRICDLEAERKLALAKLQEVNIAVSAALKEATDVREQTLKARREALAARRESIDAQSEAMKAKKEALQTKREMAEAKKALGEMIKAITAMQDEVQQIRLGALKDMHDQVMLKTLTRNCEEKIDNVMRYEKERGIRSSKRTKEFLLEKVNDEKEGEDSPGFVSVLRMNECKPTLVIEPHVIITNSQTPGIKHACRSAGMESLTNNSLDNLYSNKRGSLHGELSLESMKMISTDVPKSRIQETVLTGISNEDSALRKHLKLRGDTDDLDDVSEIVEEPTPSVEKGSEKDGEINNNSRESEDFDDDLPKSKKKDLNKATSRPPTTGSFVQKWGDFIGRISTLMITIVTAVNTAEALIDSILAASFIKAGTFAFLLVCIHIPVAAVMIWLLLKEKVQQIRDIIGKAKRVINFIFQGAKRLVSKTSSRKNVLLVDEECKEPTEIEETEAALAANSTETSSIFVVETQAPHGVVNEAFTEERRGGCNPTST